MTIYYTILIQLVWFCNRCDQSVINLRFRCIAGQPCVYIYIHVYISLQTFMHPFFLFPGWGFRLPRPPQKVALQPPGHCRRTAMAVPQQCRGTATGVPWDCHGIAMAVPLELPWQCHRTVLALPCQCHGSAIAVLLDCHDSATALPWHVALQCDGSAMPPP